MSLNENPQAVEERNQRSLNTLIRAITLSQGQFALILVRCNYLQLRDRILQRLHQSCPVEIAEILLPESAQTLYTTIQAALEARVSESGHPSALMVLGLESVTAIDQVLTATNLVREELRKQFPFPLVLWVNDRILQKLSRLSPDLRSWSGTIIEFELAIVDLVRSLKEHADRLFANVLNAGDERFQPSWTIVPSSNSLRQGEVTFALQDLYLSQYPLEPDLQANLDFLLGQDAHAQGELETARECYERSLEFWLAEAERQESECKTAPTSLLPHPSALEREACILVHLGLWWRSYATLQRSAYVSACRIARDFFQTSLELFEQANRQDLVAKFVIPLAEVLQKLGQWEELERLTRNALVLHKLYGDAVRQARDYGFLAEVALTRQQWTEAKQQTETALQILRETARTLATADPPNLHLESTLELAYRFHEGWYLLLLARAEEKLGQVAAAIDHLETARGQSFPQDDPQLYIQILQALRTFYFEKGRYLDAFRTKQTQRSLEQQFGFRAFVGALRLEPQQHLINPLAEQIDPQTLVAQEIAASGREQDVRRLLARLGRNDCKLTVIHGPSGVGKSSIVNAGLALVLKDRVIGDRIALPIVLDVYTDWLTTLHWLTEIAGLHNVPLPEQPRRGTARKNFLSAQTLIDKLREATEHQQLPTLIFDQFEEFFFAYPTLPRRRAFYEFLRDCLNLPFVKVILTLREDYLHYLLEFQRLAKLDIINNDILGRDIRYYLGDFLPEDAKAVITSLTTKAQFYLDDELVEELVRDLAGELGEVRPIELQVVGAQLQAENNTTLAEYRQKGPKEKLVERSLQAVIKDCGPENEQAAQIVLFLLTNENGTRPLMTRDDLEADLVDLGLIGDIDRLDLVLEVLVGSGLVFLVPEAPADRYQLVHDYLIDFIRSFQLEIIEQHIENLLDRELRPFLENQKDTETLKQDFETLKHSFEMYETLAKERRQEVESLTETIATLETRSESLTQENQRLQILNRLLLLNFVLHTESLTQQNHRLQTLNRLLWLSVVV